VHVLKFWINIPSLLMHERRCFLISVPQFLLSSLSEILYFFHRNCVEYYLLHFVCILLLVCTLVNIIHENNALWVHQHVSSSIHRQTGRTTCWYYICFQILLVANRLSLKSYRALIFNIIFMDRWGCVNPHSWAKYNE